MKAAATLEALNRFDEASNYYRHMLNTFQHDSAGFDKVKSSYTLLLQRMAAMEFNNARSENYYLEFC